MIIVEKLHHVNIYTHDLEKSIEFYTNLFDFELTTSGDENAVVIFDSISIQLNLDTDDISKQSYPILSFILDEDDFTDAIQELEENKVEIVQGPDKTENGEMLLIKDPGNNILEIYYQES